jgi:hypothetical protein
MKVTAIIAAVILAATANGAALPNPDADAWVRLPGQPAKRDAYPYQLRKCKREADAWVCLPGQAAKRDALPEAEAEASPYKLKKCKRDAEANAWVCLPGQAA